MTSKWTKTDDHQWELERGQIEIEISRERPHRWHANGVGGLVTARELPYQWSAMVRIGGKIIDAIEIEIADGTYVRDAKRIAAEALDKIESDIAVERERSKAKAMPLNIRTIVTLARTFGEPRDGEPRDSDKLAAEIDALGKAIADAPMFTVFTGINPRAGHRRTDGAFFFSGADLFGVAGQAAKNAAAFTAAHGGELVDQKPDFDAELFAGEDARAARLRAIRWALISGHVLVKAPSEEGYEVIAWSPDKRCEEHPATATPASRLLARLRRAGGKRRGSARSPSEVWVEFDAGVSALVPLDLNSDRSRVKLMAGGRTVSVRQEEIEIEILAMQARAKMTAKKS